MNRNALAVELGALSGAIGALAPPTTAWVIFAALAAPCASWTWDLIRHDARSEVQR